MIVGNWQLPSLWDFLNYLQEGKIFEIVRVFVLWANLHEPTSHSLPLSSTGLSYTWITRDWTLPGLLDKTWIFYHFSKKAWSAPHFWYKISKGVIFWNLWSYWEYFDPSKVIWTPSLILFSRIVDLRYLIHEFQTETQNHALQDKREQRTLQTKWTVYSRAYTLNYSRYLIVRNHWGLIDATISLLLFEGNYLKQLLKISASSKVRIYSFSQGIYSFSQGR